MTEIYCPWSCYTLATKKTKNVGLPACDPMLPAASHTRHAIPPHTTPQRFDSHPLPHFLLLKKQDLASKRLGRGVAVTDQLAVVIPCRMGGEWGAGVHYRFLTIQHVHAQIIRALFVAAVTHEKLYTVELVSLRRRALHDCVNFMNFAF